MARVQVLGLPERVDGLKLIFFSLTLLFITAMMLFISYSSWLIIDTKTYTPAGDKDIKIWSYEKEEFVTLKIPFSERFDVNYRVCKSGQCESKDRRISKKFYEQLHEGDIYIADRIGWDFMGRGDTVFDYR